MLLYLLTRVVCSIAGSVYPAYASFKAIHSRDQTRLTAWLMYWTVMGLFTLAEFVLDTFVFWFPFYYEIKMLFVLWMILPQTQGSIYLYQAIVDPYLTQHEPEIDQTLKDIQKQAMAMGMEYIKRAINFIQNLAWDLYKKSQDQTGASSLSSDSDSMKQKSGPPPAYSSLAASSTDSVETPTPNTTQSYLSWMSPKLAAVATMASETISRHIPARPLPQPPVNLYETQQPSSGSSSSSQSASGHTNNMLGITETLPPQLKAGMERVQERLDRAAASTTGADSASSASTGSLRNRKISLYDYDSEESLLTPSPAPANPASAPPAPHSRQSSDNSWGSYIGLQRPTAPPAADQ
ncbi:receptor expression-enhancing protein 1/2/3/4 [Entomortierella parvispora]|uniref:Protein YOP1 n=1 Tax=Entomortierella parvispora TaxID=205924 RepID=A0A9P3LRL3_9FUNG|nr:receptor expression-enhancing protein 1/2/3/4 [Entomortierella parvispora]